MRIEVTAAKIAGATIGAAIAGTRRAVILNKLSADQFVSTKKKAFLIARDSTIGGGAGVLTASAGEAGVKLLKVKATLKKLSQGADWKLSWMDWVLSSKNASQTLKITIPEGGRKYLFTVTDKESAQVFNVFRWQLPKEVRGFSRGPIYFTS